MPGCLDFVSQTPFSRAPLVIRGVLFDGFSFCSALTVINLASRGWVDSSVAPPSPNPDAQPQR